MRRSSAWVIVLGGALGILGCSSAGAPSLAPQPDMPKGVAVIMPDTAGESAAASGAPQPSRSTPEHFAGISREDSAPQPAAPKLRVEPVIGVTVMGLVKNDSAAIVSVPSDSESAPAGSKSAAQSTGVGAGSPPGNADAKAGAPSDTPVAAGAPGGVADASARTADGTQISFTVGDAHAPEDAGAPGAHGAATPSAECAVQILHEKPKTAAREVATFKFDAAPAEHADVMSLLKRRACEAGANAVLIKKPEQTATAPSAGHVEAVAFVVESAVARTPKPKTIEVPLPSKPVPKTITVDPDSGP